MERVGDYELMGRLNTDDGVSFYEAQHTRSGERRLLIRAPGRAQHWAPWADPALATILQHPNIVRTYEAAAFEPVPTFVLEFVHGCSLRELLVHHRRLSPRLAAYVAREVCAGLAYALTARARDGSVFAWTHGALCPRVVHLSQSGDVKVSGFGIGRLLPAVSGTPKIVDESWRFLSPDQVSGAEPNSRSDVFVVGAVLHEMLAGAMLDASEPMEYLRELAKGTRALVRSGLGISQQLEELLGAMLSRRPADRPADAAEVLAQLAALPELADSATASRDLGELVRAAG